MLPAIKTATTSAYTAIIPDMTTGINDFIMRSGLNVPTLAIPMPDFAVPYAAPRHPKIMANAMPAMPKKGANFGVNSESAMIVALAGSDSAARDGRMCEACRDGNSRESFNSSR